ncbi:MAG: response regulator [Meiothermus sp.]|nr:response regulator [Meiothermus sp.]
MARILVVQDENKDLRTLETFLIGEGHRVVGKRTALQAMEFLAVYSPDLIVIDSHLRGMDGVTLLALIRGVPRLRDVSVVILIDPAEPNLEKMRQSQPQSVLYKPIKLEDIRDTIVEVLSRRNTSTVSSTQSRPPTGKRSRLERHLPNEKSFRELWPQYEQRHQLLQTLEQAGWGEASIRRRAGRTDADLYDCIGHLAYGWPLKSRAERAQYARQGFAAHNEFTVINALLSIYEERGLDALEQPATLQMISALDEQALRRLRGLRGYLELLSAIEIQLFPVSGIMVRNVSP